MGTVTPSRPTEGEPAAAAPDDSPDAPVTAETADGSAVYPPPQPTIPHDDIDNWAERAQTAVTTARTTRTPEAWREAGQLSMVVADVVLAVTSELTVSRRADQAARRAEETARTAEVALRIAQRATSTARDMRDAVARARTTATPEAWQVAARVASAIARASTADADEDEGSEPVTEERSPDSAERGTVAKIGAAAVPATTRRKVWDGPRTSAG